MLSAVQVDAAVTFPSTVYPFQFIRNPIIRCYLVSISTESWSNQLKHILLSHVRTEVVSSPAQVSTDILYAFLISQPPANFMHQINKLSSWLCAAMATLSFRLLILNSTSYWNTRSLRK
jgi:hypothetical protein